MTASSAMALRLADPDATVRRLAVMDLREARLVPVPAAK